MMENEQEERFSSHEQKQRQLFFLCDIKIRISFSFDRNAFRLVVVATIQQIRLITLALQEQK